MGIRTPGTNHPPKGRTSKALKRREALIAEYMSNGMSREDAETKANEEMRANEKGDWRRG